MPSKGPILVTSSLGQPYTLGASPVVHFDVAQTVNNSATTVVYTYPMTTNERLAVLDFVGLVSGYGNPGANAMYRVLARFVRSWSGVNSMVDVQQEVVSETDAGLNITAQLTGTNVEIVCTSPALNGDGAVVRVVGRIIEIKAPIPV